MVYPNCLSKKNSGGQQEEGHGVVHHLQQEHHQSMKEGSHKKVQKIRMVQNGPPYLSVKKKIRWTARGRTWSSSPSSARTSSKHEGGVPQKSPESKFGPKWSTLLVRQKNFRWTARVRTWSSPPSSARTSSILLYAPFSKCQGLTHKY